ncbi:MAG: hypothetical protein IPQ04_00050 [Saprospiraceae bacterium]|nr:hypothetical protein [Saprospiraceae bacterium]
MYQKFTNILQDIKDFLPGGPNKKYIASFLFLFIWMALFDKNRWVTNGNSKDQSTSMKEKKDKLSNDIIRTKTNDKGCQQRYRKNLAVKNI